MPLCQRNGPATDSVDLDRRFHLGLLERAGNARVTEVVDRILDHLRLAVFADGADATLATVAAGHDAILVAVRDRDPAAIERAARAHLELTRTAWHPQPPTA